MEVRNSVTWTASATVFYSLWIGMMILRIMDRDFSSHYGWLVLRSTPPSQKVVVDKRGELDDNNDD